MIKDSLVFSYLKVKVTELFGIDLRSLAFFRICLAIVVISDLLIRASDIEAFYTDSGLMPRILLLQRFSDPWNISIHLASGSFYWQLILFLLHGLLAFMLLIGFKTRLATFMLWFLFVSLHLRNPVILHGGDHLLRSLLFWSIFIPLSARWSLDSLVSFKPDITRPGFVCSAATAAILLQVAIMYFFTALLKANSQWHKEGTAIYNAIVNDQLALPFGAYIVQFPEFLKLLTHIVWWQELVSPLLLFVPVYTYFFRFLAIIFLLLLQLGICLSLRLELFPWISTIALVPHIPVLFWNFLEARFNNVIRSLDLLKEKIISGLFQNITSKKHTLKISIFEEVIVMFFLIYMLVWNIGGVYPNIKMPESLHFVGKIFLFNQYWGMFINPAKFPAWTMVKGVLKDGTEIDLSNKKILSNEKPKLVSTTYKNLRWISYISRLPRDNLRSKCYFLCNFFCKDWNKEHAGEKQLKNIQVIFFKESLVVKELTSEPEKVILCDHTCKGV